MRKIAIDGSEQKENFNNLHSIPACHILSHETSQMSQFFLFPFLFTSTLVLNSVLSL